MIAIARSGSIVFNAPINAAPCGAECWPASFGTSNTDIHLLHLEMAGEPDFVLSLFTGGAHCCFLDQVFTYRPTLGSYTEFEHDFGNAAPDPERPDPTGPVVFVAADNRFAYAFTDYADSGLPLQVWAFSAGRFSDVTRAYPALIEEDASREWHYFLARPSDDIGFIPAWAADQDLLGHDALVTNRLAHELRLGRLRSIDTPGGTRFVRDLTTALRRWGYAPSSAGGGT